MNRAELLGKLSGLIPSFRRKYIHWGKLVDKDVDKSWLYRDELYWDKNNNLVEIPETVPSDYMVGVELVLDGEKYVTVPRYKDGKRKIALNTIDFGDYGNTHKYGTLKVGGVSWKKADTGTEYFSTAILDAVPKAKSFWEVDLFKIIDDNDLSQKMEDWDCYDPNEATQRFESISELYCTAAYVALLRYQGPIELYVGELYEIPKGNKFLLVVDENDDVVVFDRLRDAISEMEERNL